ncbi:MAG: cytochrome c [Bauldia sp.]|nr:cytochrome c [Bauldia sp.]
MRAEQSESMAIRGRAAAGAAAVVLVLAGLGTGLMPARAQAPAPAVDGAEVFASSCAGCHGASGEGGLGPQLAGNADLANSALVVNQILFGGEIMPAFAPMLTDEQIVAVSNYIRTSWGNTNDTPTTLEEVTQTRTEGGPASAG